MPTINEVWEQAVQVNANLATVHNDLVALKGCCENTNRRLNDQIIRAEETNDWLEDLRQVVNNGFVAMTDGIRGIHARQELMIRLLAYQAEQNRTIICALENISRNTCQILDQADRQTQLQTRIAEDVTAVDQMYATSNPDSALVYQRHQEDLRKLEKCCPQKPRDPACTYRPCQSPSEKEIGQPPAYSGYQPSQSSVVRHKTPDIK